MVDSRFINTYTLSGPKVYRYITMNCEKCLIIYFTDCFAKNNKCLYYNKEANYIQISKYTVFERILIENIDANVARNGVSFTGKFYFDV